MHPVSSLLFHNATVLTMNPAHPRAQALAVRGGRIAGVGDFAAAVRAAGPDAERVDCGGGALLPAFIDAHCHLLAYAASLRSIDCTSARSIAEIQQALRLKAAATPPGVWLRAFGYEETALAEGRHPDRRDLDAVAPEHPVRLIHRSGHASVLNSAGLRLAGIDTSTEEPSGGVIERDLETGEPNGVLLEMEERLDGLVPPPSYDELAAGVRQAAARLLAAGITCVHDATHTNGPSEWALFERLMRDGALPLDIVMMEGITHLGELPEMAADGWLRRGAVKIMLREAGGLSPDEEELARMVGAAHEAGRQVAIHAVGERAVAAAVMAIEAAVERRPRADHRHRIEHCSELPEGIAPRLARLGAVVVSQPGFLRHRGERYLRLVPEERQAGLYAFRTLCEAGVALAAGSDAPVAPPTPLEAVAAAVDRRSAAGRSVAPSQAAGAEEALRWWTAGAAHAGFQEDERGSVRPGLRADLVLFSADLEACPPEELDSVTVECVWRAGELVSDAAAGVAAP